MPPCTALALLAAGGWLCVLLFACALGKAAQRADARAERAAAPTRRRFVAGRVSSRATGGITSTHHHRPTLRTPDA